MCGHALHPNISSLHCSMSLDFVVRGFYHSAAVALGSALGCPSCPPCNCECSPALSCGAVEQNR
eukprot:2825246-Amphidinium_carterae.1